MLIKEIISVLETLAAPALQEDYDNSGLITGDESWLGTGVLVSLDVTEDVVTEAIDKNCNLIVAHHPIIFRGFKKLTGKNYVERTVIHAIKNDIAIYAIHTNLDNVPHGVSGKIANLLGLINQKVLAPKTELLQKLVVYVPLADREKVQNGLFEAGAGHIGNYSECSFVGEGTGSFKGENGSKPQVGIPHTRHYEPEARLEVIYPVWLQHKIVAAMKAAHPYEEVAYDLYTLANEFQQAGSGIIGELPDSLNEIEMLSTLQNIFRIPVIKHSPLLGKKLKRIALCGGAGSFLTNAAVRAGADMYITGDVKYHEFFDADGRLLLADIGHYESEQFTIDLLFDLLKHNFPNFAVLKTGVNTNPVHYFGNGADPAP